MNEQTNLNNEEKLNNINKPNNSKEEKNKEKSKEISDNSNKKLTLNENEDPILFTKKQNNSDDSFENKYEDDWFNDNNELVFDYCGDDLGEKNWQIYRRGNILGQLIREYFNEEVEEYKGKLNDPFSGQKVCDMVKEYNLLTGKMCLSIDFRKQSEKKWILYLGENKQVKKYEINLSEFPVKIYLQKNLISNKELKELFEKINELAEDNPFISIAYDAHVQPVVDYEKKHQLLNKIKSVIYLACNKDNTVSLTRDQIYNNKNY